MRLEAGAGDSGKRLDAFICESAGLTRSAVQKLIESGHVSVNLKTEKKNYRISAGDILELVIPEAEQSDIRAVEMELDIVYEDGDIIVINKPKGMVVHPAAGHSDDTLVNALLAHCGDSLSGINGDRRPGIVHRIDKDTSGLLVVAKNDMAHLSLSEQIREHTCRRVYEAVVKGGFKEDSGTIDRPVGRHKTERKRMAVTERGSRSAVTHWEVIARYSGYTHIRCILETGRTHQIRVHMSSIGHPVLGDTLYGGRDKRFKLDSQCLHARELELAHPRNGRQMRFEAGLPEYFKKILTSLGNGL